MRGFPDRDFRDTVLNVWGEVLPKSGGPTVRQYEVAHYIERGPDPSREPWEYPNNLIFINAFRGIGKSWLTSAFVPHALDQWRDLDILVVSASKPRADNFSIFTKRLIYEMPWWRHMCPPDSPPANFKDKIDAFDVWGAPIKHTPSVQSLGITGQITGARADIAILDDVESLNNSMTVQSRELLLKRVEEITASVLKPGGRVIVLGTQQSYGSIYTKFPEYGFRRRIWPARMPDQAWMASNGGDLAPAIAASGLEPGKPTDTQRFDEFDLQSREARAGRSGFAMQFMLDTRPADADKFPLKCSDLIVADLDKDDAFERYVYGRGPTSRIEDLPCVGLDGDRWWGPMATSGNRMPYQSKVMAIDPSGTGKDELGYSVVAALQGTMFLLSNGGYQQGYVSATLESLALQAKYWSVPKVIVEPNYGDGMFIQILKPVFARIHPHCSIEETPWSTGQKERRIIDTLEPVMNQHRLVVNRGCVEQDTKIDNLNLAEGESAAYRLFYQMTHLTSERGCLRHDDRLESLAMAVQYFAHTMSQDELQEQLKTREERAHANLDAFMRGFDKNHIRSEPTWLDPLLNF